MAAYDYRLEVNLSSRSTGEPDPQVIFPGVLVPPSLCKLVAASAAGATVRTDEELATLSAAVRREIATAKAKEWVAAQATAQMQTMSPAFKPFEANVPVDPAIAQSDYQYWITADKFIWLPYGDDAGTTLQIYLAFQAKEDAAAFSYPPVLSTNGVQTAWFLHCRLKPIGPAQG